MKATLNCWKNETWNRAQSVLLYSDSEKALQRRTEPPIEQVLQRPALIGRSASQHTDAETKTNLYECILLRFLWFCCSINVAKDNR